VQSVHRQLSFKVDDGTGGTVIQVIDAETDQVLRQIPSEAIVALQRRLAEFQESSASADKLAVDGVLFSTRV
jgi:flagellar protein FlaG